MALPFEYIGIRSVFQGLAQFRSDTAAFNNTIKGASDAVNAHAQASASATQKVAAAWAAEAKAAQEATKSEIGNFNEMLVYYNRRIEAAQLEAKTVIAAEEQKAAAIKAELAVQQKALAEMAAMQAAPQGRTAGGQFAAKGATAADVASQSAYVEALQRQEQEQARIAQTARAEQTAVVTGRRAEAEASTEAQAAVIAEAQATERSAATHALFGQVLNTSSQVGQKALNGLVAAGQAATRTLTDLGKAEALVAVGGAVALVGAIGASTHQFIEFDNTLAQVRGATGSSTGSVEALGQAQLSLARNTGIALPEIEEISRALAQVGVSAGQQNEGILKAAVNLQLASAGALNYTDAAKQIISAEREFGIAATDSSLVADSITTALHNTTLTAQDFFTAFKQAAPIMRDLKIPLQDVNAVISVIGNQIASGAITGAGLGQMFQRLINPGKKAIETLNAWKVSLYDSKGAVRPVVDVIGDLVTRFGPAAQAAQGFTDKQRDQALATIFNTRSLKDVLAVINTTPEAWNAALKAQKDSAGSAQATADIMTNTLGKSLDKARESVRGLAIGFASELAPGLKQGAEGANAFFGSSAVTTGAKLFGATIAALVSGQGIPALRGQLEALGTQSGAAQVFTKILTGALQLRDVFVVSLLPALGNLKSAFLGQNTGTQAAEAGFRNFGQALTAAILAITNGVNKLALWVTQMRQNQTVTEFLNNAMNNLAKVGVAALVLAIVTLGGGLTGVLGKAGLLAAAMTLLSGNTNSLTPGVNRLKDVLIALGVVMGTIKLVEFGLAVASLPAKFQAASASVALLTGASAAGGGGIAGLGAAAVGAAGPVIAIGAAVVGFSLIAAAATAKVMDLNHHIAAAPGYLNQVNAAIRDQLPWLSQDAAALEADAAAAHDAAIQQRAFALAMEDSVSAKMIADSASTKAGYDIENPPSRAFSGGSGPPPLVPPELGGGGTLPGLYDEAASKAKKGADKQKEWTDAIRAAVQSVEDLNAQYDIDSAKISTSLETEIRKKKEALEVDIKRSAAEADLAVKEAQIAEQQRVADERKQRALDEQIKKETQLFQDQQKADQQAFDAAENLRSINLTNQQKVGKENTDYHIKLNDLQVKEDAKMATLKTAQQKKALEKSTELQRLTLSQQHDLALKNLQIDLADQLAQQDLQNQIQTERDDFAKKQQMALDAFQVQEDQKRLALQDQMAQEALQRQIDRIRAEQAKRDQQARENTDTAIAEDQKRAQEELENLNKELALRLSKIQENLNKTLAKLKETDAEIAAEDQRLSATLINDLNHVQNAAHAAAVQLAAVYGKGVPPPVADIPIPSFPGVGQTFPDSNGAVGAPAGLAMSTNVISALGMLSGSGGGGSSVTNNNVSNSWSPTVNASYGGQQSPSSILLDLAALEAASRR